MSKASKIAVIVAGLVLMMGTGLVYGLFHGYFDHGQFEVKQVHWSPANQAAMVVERSDEEALNGYVYFVLIGDHVFSPPELRHAYHSSAVVFSAVDGCLDLHWQGPAKLVIACNAPRMTPEEINVENHQSGGIAILYENIPSK